jgi:hypothetical protein
MHRWPRATFGGVVHRTWISRNDSKIDHPNVVAAIDVGAAPSGVFLVMELITGGTPGV